LLTCLLLLSACNSGGKDNASGSGSTPPQRGALLTMPPTRLASYSTGDILALLGVNDVGQELLSLAYSPKCSIDVYQLSYETAYGNIYTNTLRQALKSNDLRNWTPTSPVLLCAGDQDPTAFYLNTQLMQGYWTANAARGPVTVLDVDSPRREW
jgi:hypothetical protein